MKDPRRHLGNEGERLAAEFLKAKGFRILERQARIGRLGEIDLIALDPSTSHPSASLRAGRAGGPTLVFIEVKTRHDVSFGTPEEAVTAAKRRTLLACAESWRKAKGWTAHAWRLDVVAVDLTGRQPVIRHLKSLGL